VTGQYGNLKLWGPNDGSANGLPASSPDGFNYVGADGAFQVGAISQTITGLTVVAQYTVGFWWGAAQQDGFTGATTEQWQVSLGGQTQYTSIISRCQPRLHGLGVSDDDLYSGQHDRCAVLPRQWDAEWRSAIRAARRRLNERGHLGA